VSNPPSSAILERETDRVKDVGLGVVGRGHRPRPANHTNRSKRADVTLRTLIRLEHKQVAQPKVTDYARLAWVLNCRLDELIEDEWLAPLQGPGLPLAQS